MNWLENAFQKKNKLAEVYYKNAITYKVETQYESKFKSPGYCFFFFTSFLSKEIELHFDQIYFMEGYGVGEGAGYRGFRKRTMQMGPINEDEYKMILEKCIYPLKEKFQAELNLVEQRKSN